MDRPAVRRETMQEADEPFAASPQRRAFWDELNETLSNLEGAQRRYERFWHELTGSKHSPEEGKAQDVSCFADVYRNAPERIQIVTDRLHAVLNELEQLLGG